MNEQIIYFDKTDEDMDGNGWNIVSDEDSVALRFSSIDKAKNWCKNNGVSYSINYFPNF
jgi:hypothetical protein